MKIIFCRSRKKSSTSPSSARRRTIWECNAAAGRLTGRDAAAKSRTAARRFSRRSARPFRRKRKSPFRPTRSDLKNADAVIAVVGEQPYAEMKGDRNNLDLSAEDTALIAKAKASGAPVVTILFSGRPLILNSALDDSNAFVAAWLPGTEGLGMADVLFGDYKFTGKLPRTWPRQQRPSCKRRQVGETAVPVRLRLEPLILPAQIQFYRCCS